MKVLTYNELAQALSNDVAPITKHSRFSVHGVNASAENSVPEIVRAYPARMNSKPRRVRMHRSVPIPALE
jgi:hypothetical protein